MPLLPYSYTRSANLNYPATFWRSLLLFNVYRMVVASILMIAALSFQMKGDTDLDLQPGSLITIVSAYWLFSLVAFGTIRARWPMFNVQLSVQVSVDIIIMVTLMYLNGGIRSGLGLLLMPYLAAAGLISRGRMTLFHAAIASIGVLAEQTLRMLLQENNATDFGQPVLLSIGYFATAWLGYRLAQHATESEKVALQRGIDLANLAQINQLIIQDMPDGVIVIDEKGVIRSRNQQADRLLGPPPFRERLTLSDYLPELELAAKGWLEGHTQGDLVLKTNSGKQIHPRFVPIAANRAAGAVIFIEDVHRQQALAQQMKLAALGRLTANIAHEIRNPLSSIGHAAELLSEDKSDPLTVKLTRIIRDNTRRLDGMVQDILQLNRRDRAQPEQIRLAGFLDSFIEELSQAERIPANCIDIQIEETLVVGFDRNHLHQILWNLTRNAWRYCKQAQGSIRILARHDGNQGWIDVTDDGPGVPPEHRAKLFEPFFTTDDSHGSGLGLYIAREVAAANHASLDYVAKKSGATFRLTCRIWQ
ncbi:two-component system sensor histidine kinase PilS (NtrC family) [Chitinivorax tropicus]|uniref:histidine kinase n=1 Tax=Chitinivorax tropicus TaxID=714531 RepID=A0A840MNG6_9PROT|nr:ATP-binding protein [Chitinivorax tropicus]MBB5018292.1 two-component system sensor histidine kinase PilS (NtrC family) [Chitinivorax tropicus]